MIKFKAKLLKHYAVETLLFNFDKHYLRGTITWFVYNLVLFASEINLKSVRFLELKNKVS